MAGRRPTQQGLRFFVDSLLQLGDLARGREARDRRAHRQRRRQPARRDGRGVRIAFRPGRRRGAGGDARARRAGAARRDRVDRPGPSAAGAGVRRQPGREPPHHHAGRHARRRAGGGGELSQRPLQGPHAGGSARRRRRRAGARPRRARSGGRQAGAKAAWSEWSGEDPDPGPLAHRARPRQPAAGSAGRGRPRTGAAAVRRSGKDPRTDPGARSGQGGRKRARLHRLGKPAFFAVGVELDRRALYERRAAGRRRAGRDRPDPR